MSDHEPETPSEVHLCGAQARELADLLGFLGQWLTDSEDNEDLAASLARLPEGAGDETMLQVQVQVQVALSRFAALLDPSGEVDF
jgi:carbonic anhydrase